eukprot:g55860.t1
MRVVICSRVARPVSRRYPALTSSNLLPQQYSAVRCFSNKEKKLNIPGMKTMREQLKVDDKPKEELTWKDRLKMRLTSGLSVAEDSVVKRVSRNRKYTAEGIMAASKMANFKMNPLPEKLISTSEAILVPATPCIRLDDSSAASLEQLVSAKITLMVWSFKEIGYEHLEAWIKPWQEQYGDFPRFQVLWCCGYDQWLIRKFFRSKMINALRDKVTKERQPFHYLFFDEIEKQLDHMEMENRVIPYLFLVDPKGRVRCVGTGMVSPGELDRLFHLTNQLGREAFPHLADAFVDRPPIAPLPLADLERNVESPAFSSF